MLRCTEPRILMKFLSPDKGFCARCLARGQRAVADESNRQLDFRRAESYVRAPFLPLVAMRHIISVLLANEAGALSRVAGLFSARGYNIESLTVAPTQTPSVSRLTLTTTGSDEVIAQINKQLKKLVDVVDLADWTVGGHIEREILLLKLNVAAEDVESIAARADKYGALVLDDSAQSLTLEFTGTGSELDDFVADMTRSGQILEMVRSGVSAIGCGNQTLKLHG